MYRSLSLSLLLGLSACAGDSDNESQRSAPTDVGSYSFVDAEIIEDKDGVITAKLVPKENVVNIVKASSSSTVSKSKAEFFPGAFLYTTEISIGESPWHVAAPSVLTELGLGKDVYIEAIGTPVLLQWAYDENTSNDYKFYIPDVAGKVASDDTLVVIYKINLPDTSDFNVGMIPSSELNRVDGMLEFKAKSYGIFQAATLSQVVAKPPEQTSIKPLDSGVTAAPKGPPAPFSVVVDQIVERPLHGATLRLLWNPAGGASSFKITIDDDDPACKTPVKTIENLKVISTLLPTIEGQNHVCVYAVNQYGETPATNNGKLSFQADATLPAVPQGLTHTVSGINVKVTWQSALDQGQAGFAFYELQVGTTKDGTEQFNGPIPVATSYEFVGFGEEGLSYYARVRTVDKAGNASAWSTRLGPITQ